MMPTTFKEFILPCKNNKSLGNLLFIHGFCVDHTYFTAANKLSEHFDVYMIDLPGHGTNNDNITPKDLKLNKMAQYIVDYINFKKLDNIYLMGHSMGGALVSLVERLIPTKIKKLILVCPANPAAIHAGLKSFYIFYPKNMEQKTRLLRCLYAPNNFDTYSKNPA
jgi:pimeloyl-ACP methyl ester carboxylesterase